MNQHTPWSETENEVLGRFYPSSDWFALIEKFPNRTIIAISRQASKIGVRRKRFVVGDMCKEIIELAQRRKSAGISQRKVADVIGYDARYVCYWEHGQRRITGFQIKCYHDALERLGA